MLDATLRLSNAGTQRSKAPANRADVLRHSTGAVGIGTQDHSGLGQVPGRLWVPMSAKTFATNPETPGRPLTSLLVSQMSTADPWARLFAHLTRAPLPGTFIPQSSDGPYWVIAAQEAVHIRLPASDGLLVVVVADLVGLLGAIGGDAVVARASSVRAARWVK